MAKKSAGKTSGKAALKKAAGSQPLKAASNLDSVTPGPLSVQDARQRLNITVDLIPTSNSNRPGTPLQARQITIHNTDNDDSTANARAHAAYMKGADAMARQVSWHFSVDDGSVYQSLPVNEVGWHAGSHDGNATTIGIEICQNQGIDHDAANSRAALLTALMLRELRIDIEGNVVQHNHWSGKDCPKLLRHPEERWTAFLAEVASSYAALAAEPVSPSPALDSLSAPGPCCLANTAMAESVPPGLVLADPAVMGALAADSSDVVTSVHGGASLLDKARTLLGTDPVFWGRYFKEAGNTSSVQYQPHLENAALSARGIRVLPLARQTNHVGGSTALGRQEAQRYVGALFWAFGMQHLAASGGVFYLFLDVEPDTPLSAAYYTGWASEIESFSLAQSNNTVRFLPCVYLNQGDETTLQSIRTAMAAGIKCQGLWTAHYFNHFDDTGCHRPGPWDPSMAMPVHPPAPVLAWQFIGDCWGELDASQVNPAIDLQNDLLRFLVPPPGTP